MGSEERSDCEGGQGEVSQQCQCKFNKWVFFFYNAKAGLVEYNFPMKSISG